MKFISMILMIASSYTYAHGGGGSAPSGAEKKAEKKEDPRHIPHHPEAIDEDKLIRYLSAKSIMPDVTTISCKLGEFTSCRGLEIGLYDLNGKLLAKGHTGTGGAVGFEGLKKDGKFIAKIEGEKYFGEARVQAGGSYGIYGGEKVVQLSRRENNNHSCVLARRRSGIPNKNDHPIDKGWLKTNL